MQSSNKEILLQKARKILHECADDAVKVFEFGCNKHPDSGTELNFMQKDGNKCSLHDRGSSILRHGARTFMHPELLDEESGLPELLHLLSSVCIMYIRHKHTIVHSDDEVKND